MTNPAPTGISDREETHEIVSVDYKLVKHLALSQEKRKELGVKSDNDFIEIRVKNSEPFPELERIASPIRKTKEELAKKGITITL